MNFLTKRHTAATIGAGRVVRPPPGSAALAQSPSEVPSMHIPDAVLDPRVAAVTGVIGAAGLGYGLRAIEKQLGERTVVLMGTMSAFVFAAQMVNFPIGPLPVSGHLIGGVLAGVVFGPWGGAGGIGGGFVVA